MRRLVCLIQPAPYYRRNIFVEGARKLGYKLVTLDYNPNVDNPFVPDKEDMLITWNRYGNHSVYDAFTGAKAPVLIVENGYLGKGWLGDTWFAISLNHHNGAGVIPKPSHSRLAETGWKPAPYRTGGEDIVLLPQRGIGEAGVAMPQGWAKKTFGQLVAKFGTQHNIRVREHPGQDDCIPLEKDLENARAVVTWGSGAALKALAMGIPCISTWDNWIGNSACTPLKELVTLEHIPQVEREPMFEQLLWGMWRASEIESGEATSWLTTGGYEVADKLQQTAKQAI